MRILFRILPALFLLLLISPIQSQSTPQLSVDVNADRHPISTYIYGMNNYAISTDKAFLSEINLPVERWGGNHTSRFNWKTNSSNPGDDWYYTGLPNSDGDPGTGGNSVVDDMIVKDQSIGAKSLVTIPIGGLISKGRNLLCAYSIAKYGAQEAVNPYVGDGDCGNGKTPDGTQITGNDPMDTSMSVDASYMADWVSYLKNRFGAANENGVRFYAYDNEPSGWANTHRDIHPETPSYQEIRDRTYAYGAAIKAADPTAKTMGPVDFGWAVYVGNPDNTDGLWYAKWYLQEMRKYEEENGVRVLDYFTQNYYPSSDGPSLANVGDDGSAETRARRLRSTRSLWDPTYDDKSWIGQWYDPIQLIPSFRSWVNEYYPGTKIAITEYNWGAMDSINGALAQADVLGIFGREQLDLATLWGPPESDQPGAFAFRIYRNYDGQGSMFGDTSVRSTSTDQGQLAIYAAQRTSDEALTLVVINKTGDALTSDLSLSGFDAASTGEVYTYSESNLNAIIRQADQTVSPSGFTRTYPANSITLIVVPKADTTTTTEFLVNGGFEQDGGWEIKNSTGDKRVCNKPDVNKTFSHSGSCAFRFKGGTAENSTLSQNIQNPALASGDILSFSVWANAKNLSSQTAFALKVKYAEGSEKFPLDVNTGTYPYTQFSTTASLISAPVKISVKVTYKELIGKLIVDDFILTPTSSSALLALPSN